MSVYRYQVPDEGDNSDDDDSDSGDQNVVEDKSVDGIPPAESATVDGEEPKSPLDVPLAVSAPATGPVSSSSSSSSSSAAASVDVSKSRQCMTIEQWDNAPMSEVLDDMGVFTGDHTRDPKRDPKSAITDAERGLLNKLYCDGKYKGPHVAVARLLFLIADKTFWALNLPCVFISGTNPPKSDSKSDKSQLNVPVFKSEQLVTIAPFISSSPQTFAHSERAVGVYLLNQVKTNEIIKKILCNCTCECVIIQIKCALPSCEDCIKFWSKPVRVLSVRKEGKEPPEKRSRTDENRSGVNAKTGRITVDWLKCLKRKLKAGCDLGICISYNGTSTDGSVSEKRRFERLLKKGEACDGKGEDIDTNANNYTFVGG